MKTISIADVPYYVMSETHLAEGKTRLTLVPVHGTGVFSICRDQDGSYSDWKGCPKSPQERTPL